MAGFKGIPTYPILKVSICCYHKSYHVLYISYTLPCASQPVYKFFNIFAQNYLVSSVTQAAHLCISDQKHLQRKHCIKIPGFGLSFPGLWECRGLLNSDPSISLRLHKGKYKLNIICMFTTATSSVSCTLRTFGSRSEVLEAMLRFLKAPRFFPEQVWPHGLELRCGPKRPP